MHWRYAVPVAQDSFVLKKVRMQMVVDEFSNMPRLHGSSIRGTHRQTAVCSVLSVSGVSERHQFRPAKETTRHEDLLSSALALPGDVAIFLHHFTVVYGALCTADHYRISRRIPPLSIDNKLIFCRARWKQNGPDKVMAISWTHWKWFLPAIERPCKVHTLSDLTE